MPGARRLAHRPKRSRQARHGSPARPAFRDLAALVRGAVILGLLGQTDRGGVMDKPTLAVWKLASPGATGASSPAGLRGRTARAGRAGDDRHHFLEASSAVIPGPYDVSLVEGSITTPGDAERIRRIRRTVRSWCGSAPAPPPAGSRRCEISSDVDEFTSVWLIAKPRTTSRPRHLHSGLGPCPDRLPAARMSDRSPSAARGTRPAFLAGRKPELPVHGRIVHGVARTAAHMRDRRRRYPPPGSRTHAGCGALCPAY